MSNDNGSGMPLDGIVTEKELCEILGVGPVQLQYLRRARFLPFVNVGKGRRIYLQGSLMEWFRQHEIVLNKAT